MAVAGPGNLGEDPLSEMTTVTRATKSASVPSFGIAAEQLSSRYNLRSPAVKRILREAAEMAEHEDKTIFARPLEDNIFEWHFTFRGPPDTVYHRGVYHGRLILPSQYPMSPPDIIMITPSGRFDTGNKICLSISNYHPESWQPSWSIRTALTALRSFMATNCPGAIGSIDSPSAARKQLAINSSRLECVQCGVIGNILDSEPPEAEPDGKPKPPFTTPSGDKPPDKPEYDCKTGHQTEYPAEAEELLAQIRAFRQQTPREGESDLDNLVSNQPESERVVGSSFAEMQGESALDNPVTNQPESEHDNSFAEMQGERKLGEDNKARYDPERNQRELNERQVRRFAAEQQQMLNLTITFVVFMIIGIILRRVFGLGYE